MSQPDRPLTKEHIEKVRQAAFVREGGRNQKFLIDGVVYDNACRAAAALGMDPRTVTRRAQPTSSTCN